MRWAEGWRQLTRVWRRDTALNVDDELAFHFAQKTAELTALGLSVDEARQRAEAEFGDVEAVRESLREIDDRLARKQQRAAWWEAMAQDLRYVVRSLRRSPGFTGMVVATLALGLGANAAIFSLLDRLYLQVPSGVHDAANVRRVRQDAADNNGPYTRSLFSLPELRELRATAPSPVQLAGYSTQKVLLGRTADAPEAIATFVEGDYFGILGVQPALGRFFSPDERRVEGQAMVAVISHSLWMRQFDGDRTVLGRTLDLSAHRHVIVGVAPPDFHGLEFDAADVWVPINTRGTLKDRSPDWYERKDQISTNIVARVPGRPVADVFNARATASLRVVRSLGDSLSVTHLASIIEGRGGEAHENEVAISTRLAGVAAAILLIACANVVNLLLARASERRREIALRLTLGVSRPRLVAQLVTESAVLALLAVLVALVVAYFGVGVLRQLMLPDIRWSDAGMNSRVVLFTVWVALLAGFAAGLVPALQATHPDLSGALKSSIRDGGQRRSPLRSTLMAAQAALSIVLLAGAGLFVRSLRSVEAIDIGYDANQLVYAEVRYDNELENHDQEIQLRLPEVAARVRRMPGVESAALSMYAPMNGMSWTSLFLPGRDSLPPSGGMERIMAVVSPEFFATVGIAVLRGRGFAESDREGSELVIAVNEIMAKNFWPGEDPLTKCITLRKRDEPCRRVVAVVSPAHFNSIIEKPSMLYYLPLAQAGPGGARGVAGDIVVRSAPGQAGVVGERVRRELAAAFAPWSRPAVKTMEQVLARQLRPRRVGATLFTLASMLALAVAAVGVYSSIAYAINQRRQEMGVRVALGAQSVDIMRLVVSEGVRVVAVGMAIGIVAALALGSLISSLLYETSPRDPSVLAASSVVLMLVAVIAAAIPAWRASRVDPLSAMRAE